MLSVNGGRGGGWAESPRYFQGLAACQTKWGKAGTSTVDFSPLHPKFEAGDFDNELKQTHDVNFKAPIWKFIKDFRSQVAEQKDDQVHKAAAQELADMEKALLAQDEVIGKTMLRTTME